MKVEIKKLNENAVFPTYGTSHAAGADICSIEDKTIEPGERYLFKTGLAMAVPKGTYGRIAPRSGLALKKGIDVMAGVIDEDYRGEIGIILINLGKEPAIIKSGDKIAQIIFENYTRCEFSNANYLNNTSRGDGGFGSTDRQKIQKPNRESEQFTLIGKTTIEQSVKNDDKAKIDMLRAYCANFPGDIYLYQEKGMKGICVVDASGTVLNKIIIGPI